jgi:hypothetical protein
MSNNRCKKVRHGRIACNHGLTRMLTDDDGSSGNREEEEDADGMRDRLRFAVGSSVVERTRFLPPLTSLLVLAFIVPGVITLNNEYDAHTALL